MPLLKIMRGIWATKFGGYSEDLERPYAGFDWDTFDELREDLEIHEWISYFYKDKEYVFPRIFIDVRKFGGKRDSLYVREKLLAIPLIKEAYPDAYEKAASGKIVLSPKIDLDLVEGDDVIINTNINRLPARWEEIIKK